MSTEPLYVTRTLIIVTSIVLLGETSAPDKGVAFTGSRIDRTACGCFGDAHRFVAALYPELEGKKLVIGYRATFDFDSDTEACPNEFAVDVTPAPRPPIAGYISTGPKKRSPDVDLRAGFWLDKKGRIWMYTADGTWPLNSEKNKAISEIVDSHPQWTDKQVIDQLKAAGARFGPDDKEALLNQLPIERLTPFLGRLRITTAEFHVRHEQDDTPLPLLSWDVEIEGVTSSAEHFSYYMVLEPFNGRVVLLKRRPL
jgi:hypothetical protein